MGDLMKRGPGRDQILKSGACLFVNCVAQASHITSLSLFPHSQNRGQVSECCED